MQRQGVHLPCGKSLAGEGGKHHGLEKKETGNAPQEGELDGIVGPIPLLGQSGPGNEADVPEAPAPGELKVVLELENVVGKLRP